MVTIAIVFSVAVAIPIAGHVASAIAVAVAIAFASVVVVADKTMDKIVVLLKKEKSDADDNRFRKARAWPLQIRHLVRPVGALLVPVSALGRRDAGVFFFSFQVRAAGALLFLYSKRN